VPALPSVPNVIKLILKQAFTGATQDVINRLFFHYTGSAPTDTLLDAFTSAVIGSWETDIEPLVTPAVTLTAVEAEDLTSATGAVGATGSAGVGTRAGGVLPANAAVCISLGIARRYRGGHPRVYLPAGSDTDLANRAEWLTASQTAFQTGFSDFVTAVEGEGWAGAGTVTLCNVSYYTGFTNHLYPSGRERAIPNLRGTPLVDTIETIGVNPLVCSQRRRAQTP
jgi:hypothetical protein